MENNNKDIEKEKNLIKIKRKLISKELDELLKPLLAFIVLTCLFGYAGYTYSIDNNLDIKHGIIFGSLFPLGIALIKYINFDSIIAFIVYTIAYICLVQYLPTLVGIIILVIILSIFVAAFIHIEKKDRVEEIERFIKAEEIKNNTNKTIKTINAEDIIKSINRKSKKKFEGLELEDVNNEDLIYDDEIYECERCFKKISYEEYELNDCMCEDCYQDVHTDKNGNFHDDEYFDF